jgi:hypothetical protein
LPAKQVLPYVLQHAGARPQQRDAIDARIVSNVQQKKGKLINSQDEAGGYPNYAPTYRKLDVPATNIEQWLQQMAAAME